MKKHNYENIYNIYKLKETMWCDGLGKSPKSLNDRDSVNLCKADVGLEEVLKLFPLLAYR